MIRVRWGIGPGQGTGEDVQIQRSHGEQRGRTGKRTGNCQNGGLQIEIMIGNPKQKRNTSHQNTRPHSIERGMGNAAGPNPD